MAGLAVSTGLYSVAGRKPRNEDCIGIQIPAEPLLTTKGVAAAVADGVSGSDAGGEAAHAAVRGFLQDYYSTPESWTVKQSGARILTALNRWLFGLGQSDRLPARGMVTTFSALVLKSAAAHLFHVGDCRVVLLRDGESTILTREHRVFVSGDREYLNRALGVDHQLEIDYRQLAIEPGDLFLLTTDGVHDFLPGVEIVRILSAGGNNLEQSAREIVEAALQHGSGDNISCQIVRVDQVGDADEQAFYQQLTALPFPPELKPGMVLDGYRILRELHATPHIQVYLALDTGDGTEVVLKTPSLNHEDDAGYIDKFVHEEWVGKRIDNPHVMKVLGERRRRTFLYYVAEYIDGRTLRQWMDDHPAPALNEMRDIIEQIAAGLRAFKRLEMVHQDLKPENIMIDRHGVVKIIDFGSTRIPGLAEISTPTDRNAVVGTLDFLAPECFRGLPGTHQSDIYSLGVIAYQMLTGRLPYGR